VTPTPAPKPGPAPTGPAPTPAPPKLRGPGIKVSVHKRHGLITVTASCSTACRLDGYLMTRRTGRHSRLHTQSVKHSSTFTTRSRTLHFRIPAHAAGLKPQAQIVVVSFDRSGMSSRATRKVRIR
jgi:hypothetical protein